MVCGLKLSKQLIKILTKDGLRSLSDIPEDEIMLFADDANAPVTFYDETSKKRKGYFHTVAFSEIPARKFLEGADSDEEGYMYDNEAIENTTIIFLPYFIEGRKTFRKGSRVDEYYDIVLSKTLNEYIEVDGDKLSAIVLCRFFYDTKNPKLVREYIERDKKRKFNSISIPANYKTIEYYYKQYTGDVGSRILKVYSEFGSDYDVVTRVEDRHGVFLYYNRDELKESKREKYKSGKEVYLKEGIDYFTNIRDLNEELRQLEKMYKKKRVMVAV